MVSKRGILRLLFLGWLVASIAGMSVLWMYQATEGVAADAPAIWPRDSAIDRVKGRRLLLVWVHPHCPCTRATIAELERLLVHVPNDVDCRAVLTSPPKASDDFVDSSLTHTIRQLPRVSVTIDRGQSEARRFGVATSGQVLFYNHAGRLTFAGGITAARGHEGNNEGVRRLWDSLNQEPANCRTSKLGVFGCPLFAPADAGSPRSTATDDPDDRDDRGAAT